MSIYIPQWILPLGFILAGLLAGTIGEKIIFSKLRQIITSHKVPGSEIIFRSLHHMNFIWLTLAGCFGAVLASGLPPYIQEVFQKIITIIFLFSVTLALTRLTAGFVNLFIQKTEVVSPSLISYLAKVSVLILGILITLQTAGIQITPLATTLGIGGLGVALGLRETLANVSSGVYLIISKQVRTGDYVKIESNAEGYVIDINWRNTTIKELDNNTVIVPNSKFSSATFINYHLPEKKTTLTMDLGVSYDSDLEEVERVIIEVAKEVMREIAPELLTDEPYIRFHRFNDFSIDLTLYMYVNEFFDQRMCKHLFVKKLHKRHRQQGIAFPSPLDMFIYMPGKGNGINNGLLKKA